MYLRGYPLGDTLPLRVICTDDSRQPVQPDAAPRARVYAASGACVAEIPLAPVEGPARVGFFGGTLRLDHRFAVGHYRAVVRWTVGAHHGGAVVAWTVQPGGSESGDVLALDHFERPQANFLVQQRSSGRLYRGKNPRL